MAVTGPHPLSSALSALPHQDRVADKLEDAPASQGILAHHGTGTGKTFTAINAAKRLNLPILAITPASLRTNFKKEMTAAGNPVPHQIVSYQEALNRINNPEFRALAQRSLVVADEAQNFGQDGSERSSLMSRLPGRKLLLSATPIRNSPHEIAPLINAAAPGSLPEGQAAFDSKYVETKEVPVGFWGRLRGAKPGVIHVPTNLDDFAKAVKGKVDFHENIDRSNFPTYHESIIQVPMTPKQQATYDFVLGKYPAMAYKVRHGIPPSKTESKNMTAFFSGPRQISNHPGEFNASATDDDAPKFKAAADEIQKRMKGDKNFRGVAYSNFLEAGMDPMSRELDRRGISHVKFNGDMNDKEKAEAVKQYNTGQVPVLLISGAGAEGLDLKGTKLMQIMEPHWNEEKINQVRGRAIRYKSHSHLPEEERHVEVHRYHAVPVMSWLGNMLAKAPYGHGADEYIHHIAKEKQELNQPFLDVLKREGGEQNSKAAEVDSFLFVEFTKTAVAPFQAMANLPRMLAGNNSGTWHSAMHGLADKLEVPAQAVDRRITRTGKQVSGTFSDMMNPSGAYRSYRPGAASVDAEQMKYDKHLTKSTGVPHVDGLPNFEHPEVKSVMDRVHAGELKTPEFPDHDEELHMYRWAKQQSSLPKTPAPVAPPVNQVARNLTLPTRPGYGLSPVVLPANHKLPFPSMKTGTIMSQLHPDDPTKRFDYSHEIGELQRRPQMMASKQQEAAAKAEESEQAKADAAVTKKQDLEFRSQERALKLQLHEAKLQDYALKLQGQKQKQEHEQLKRIHDQANMEVESASNGVAEAQQRLDAALASLSGETPVPAKAAEWTSPTNLAVHADKHGHEFGGADNYIAAEAALSENPPEDLQPVNSRCQLPSADPAHVPRCSTAYFSPSLQVMHVKDNASQKTVTLYRRTKAPLPSLNTSSASSPPPTP